MEQEPIQPNQPPSIDLSVQSSKSWSDWGRGKIDILFTQFPALLLALVFIAVAMGWISSPVLQAAQQMVSDHTKILGYGRATCLNVADLITDPKTHESAVRRCE